jgi:hypothetical protein
MSDRAKGTTYGLLGAALARRGERIVAKMRARMTNSIVLWLALLGAFVTALDFTPDVRCPGAESAGALSDADVDEDEDPEDSSLLPSHELTLHVLPRRLSLMTHGRLQDRPPSPPPIRPPIV